MNLFKFPRPEHNWQKQKYNTNSEHLLQSQAYKFPALEQHQNIQGSVQKNVLWVPAQQQLPMPTMKPKNSSPDDKQTCSGMRREVTQQQSSADHYVYPQLFQ